MKLSRFLKDHIEEILKEWESFARTLGPAAAEMSPLALRDHGQQILEAIALDIETAQTPKEQLAKSKGLAPDDEGAESAASTHGTSREVSGFTLLQLTAEFRALRASVLRLWLPHIQHITEESSNDILRFNEAIDQALAESAVTYSEHAARTRDTFLAILGHDLRSPLAAMSMAGDILGRPDLGAERTAQVGVRVKRSAATMTTMVNDLLEYARNQLGAKMPMLLHQADMEDICLAALHDASAAHPRCPFEIEALGELSGSFDDVRLQQVFTNLLNNAAQYRSDDYPVTIVVHGEPDSVIVRVKNRGPAIPAASLQAIFSPLVQLPLEGQQGGRPATSLGLGLYVAREITIAHGGTIEVESNEHDGTVFTVRLPRTQST